MKIRKKNEREREKKKKRKKRRERRERENLKKIELEAHGGELGHQHFPHLALLAVLIACFFFILGFFSWFGFSLSLLFSLP